MLDKDLYEILGVSKGASESEIRKAFHKHAKKYHPDVNQGDKAAEQKFKEVNLAYEVLKDKKKRAHYDQMRAQGRNPFAQNAHAGGGGHFDPDAFADFGLGDLFEEIFGRGGFSAEAGPMGRGRTTYRTRGFAQRGHDREAALTISFQEAARGSERVLDLGGGRRISVKIPEGVEDGTKIKLSGQGDPGHNGGPNGDLLLRLQVLSHKDFKREKQNVVLPLAISFSEAVLGKQLEIPTLDGSVQLKIPAGISSGQRLRLKGKGIAASRNGQRGDQFVEIQIKVPKAPDDDYVKAAKLLENHPFNPRG
ncbi:MAG: J domain-containing protein [Bdellovibrionaceae bacterium]|nr:J domain-containing protein [Bdellovibrionales bacterium]MCB9254970.1 J domain-containing protein [Pseudobdellovibrionaceae bacterium]